MNHWVMFVLAILASALADVHEVRLTKIESRRDKLIRLGLWTEHMKEKGFSGDQVLHDVTQVSNYDAVEYVADITIGTPEQSFRVIVSTGSSDFFVPDVSCRKSRGKNCESPECDLGACCQQRQNACNGKNFFDARASSSYVKMEGRWIAKWPVAAEGVVGNDTVRIGAIGSKQLVIPTTAFGQATKFTSSFTGTDVDGVMGLGLPMGAAGGITSPVNRAMDLHLLDKSLFTVYMKTANGQREVDGGVITYGAIDKVHCGPVIAYEPLTTKTHWQFEVKAMKSGKYVSAATWRARSDTSSPFIEIPAPEAAAIADAHGAKWDDNYGHYVVDCTVKATMELTIGQHKYTIGSENLVVPTPDGRCVLGTEASAHNKL
ncbi:eukaryotic aspartyl protease, partial [Ostertagia ostertagi]